MRIYKVFTFGNGSNRYVGTCFLNSLGKFFLSVSFLVFSFGLSNAQQMAGGEITYTCQSATQYEVTLTLYAKCPSPGLKSTASVLVRSASKNYSLQTTLNQFGSEVTIQACQNATSRCNGGVITDENTESIVKRVYKGVVSIPSTSKDWIIETSTNQRTLDLNAMKNGIMYLRATLNNELGCNSSTTFGNQPYFFVSKNQANTYDPILGNPDGNQLSVSLTSPMVNSSTNATYNAPFSASNPFGTTAPISINASNGSLSFTPSNQGDKSSVAILVKEFKNGVEVGSVMREMYTQTLSEKTSLPYFGQIQDLYTICYGTSGAITITALSDLPNTTIDMYASGSNIVSANYTKVNQKSTMTLNINTLAVTANAITLTLIDSKCGKITKKINVNIASRQIITTPQKDTSIICRRPFPLNVTALGGTLPYTYLWSNGDTTASTIAKDPGTYSVTVYDANKCAATWKKVVSSNVNFIVGQSRCANSTIQFTDASSNPLIKKWNWKFETNTAFVKDAGPNPTHIYTNPGKKRITMEVVSSDSTCSTSIAKTITIFQGPKLDFIATDTCVKTEQSDLAVQHFITTDANSDTTINPSNIKFYLNGNFSTTATIPGPTKLGAIFPGDYTVKMEVLNDAGCTAELTKIMHVRDKPSYVVYPIRPTYFYRCDSPTSIDTVFNFKVKAVDDVPKQMQLTVARTRYADSIVTPYNSLDPIVVPYHIVWNQMNNVTIKMKDSLGCTNDTVVSILDPITPVIDVKKYYCFFGDTLILTDTTYMAQKYNWGLATSTWDLQDGTIDPSFGLVKHKYTTLDEAKVTLKVKDNTGCEDDTSKVVYLSEPDTSQFSLSKYEACFSDTLTMKGIQGKYINSWYYRYKDSPNLVVSNYDKLVTNPTFGVGYPSVNTILDPKLSSQFTATTAIYYNDSTLNKGCYRSVSRNWEMLQVLSFDIKDDYDHCMDSNKVFRAKLNVPVTRLTLDTTSWSWTLLSPGNSVLNKVFASKGDSLIYNPSTNLFNQVATTRTVYNQLNQYLPYHVNVNYVYVSDKNTQCTRNYSLAVANEKVFFKLKPIEPTCAFYTETIEFENGVSDFWLPDSDSILADMDNSTFQSTYPIQAKYPDDGTYNVKVKLRNEYECTYEDSVEVVVKPTPLASLVVDTVCYGAKSRLDGSRSVSVGTPERFYWYYGFQDNGLPKNINDPNEPDTTLATDITRDSVLFKMLEQTTNVILAVKNGVGCYSYTNSKVAKVNPNPKADYNALTVNYNDTDYLGNEPIAFDDLVPSDSATRTWDMGNGDILQSPSGAKEYDITYTYPYFAPPFPKEKNIYNVELKVKTKLGCADSVTKTIDVNSYFVLPGAFSPNEDGMHDVLLGIGKGLKELKEFKIFNRWGEEVQNLTGIPQKDDSKRGYVLWDGKYKGQIQPVGSYVYYAVIKTGNGDEFIFKGNLAILK